MVRWRGMANRGAFTLAAVLCVAAATPLAAQQASGPPAQGSASAAPASAPNTTQAGPRIRPEWQRVEPSFADSSASGSMAAAGTHTFTVTTLVLVLVVIIAVLLLAD